MKEQFHNAELELVRFDPALSIITSSSGDSAVGDGSGTGNRWEPPCDEVEA